MKRRIFNLLRVVGIASLEPQEKQQGVGLVLIGLFLTLVYIVWLPVHNTAHEYAMLHRDDS